MDNGAEMIGWQLRRQGRDGVPSDRTIHRVLVRRGMVQAQPQKRPKTRIDGSNTTGRMRCWQIDATDWRLHLRSHGHDHGHRR